MAGGVIKEGGKIYVKFDEIRVKQESPGLVRVDYYWKNERVYIMHVDMIDFASQQSLLLKGIEGRMGVAIDED